MSNKTLVNGLKCNTCGDFIYSRARHDFHWCSCGNSDTGIFVDGGFDYMRAGCGKSASYESASVTVRADKAILYSDWNYGKDKYGLIKAEDFKTDEYRLAERILSISESCTDRASVLKFIDMEIAAQRKAWEDDARDNGEEDSDDE